LTTQKLEVIIRFGFVSAALWRLAVNVLALLLAGRQTNIFVYGENDVRESFGPEHITWAISFHRSIPSGDRTAIDFDHVLDQIDQPGFPDALVSKQGYFEKSIKRNVHRLDHATAQILERSALIWVAMKGRH
jgi:hypothetical protein